MKDKYTCAYCGQVFNKGRTDEEAMSEMVEDFGEDSRNNDYDVICDTCYNKMHPKDHPDKVEETKERLTADQERKKLQESGGGYRVCTEDWEPDSFVMEYVFPNKGERDGR